MLPLLNLAENEKLGITTAILYAYRFGYLAGRKGTPACYDPLKTQVYEMLNEIENSEYLMKIYYFIKVFWKDAKSGVDIGGTLKEGHAI